MGKIALFLSISIILQADVKTSYLTCHKANQIPSQLIYKRYLLKYSTKKNIEDAIYNYLINPTKNSSIMPSAFFNKFPMKEAIDKEGLRDEIREFIEIFDVRKRLVLE